MRTKRIIPLLLVALAASCGRETVETPASSGDASSTLMGFTTLAGDASTRGTELTQTNLASFEVWTYADAALYVSGDVTKQSNGTWSYNNGNSRYWPLAEVKSYAIAPAGAVAAAEGTITENVPNDQNGLTALAAPTVSYTLPAPGPNQKDLLFAKAESYIRGKMPTGGAIPVVFSHALAQISFKAYKAAKEGNTFGKNDVVTVTGITLTGLKNSGTAPVQAPAVWGSLGGNATYDFSFTREGEDAGTTVAGAIVASSVATAPTELDAKVTDGTTTTDAGAIFMMPQTLAGAGDGDVTVTMTVNYSVNNTPEKPVTVPLTGTWLAGGTYAITLAISPSEVAVEPFVQTFTTPTTTITIGTTTVDHDNNPNTPAVPYPAGYYYVEAWGGDGGTGNQITGQDGNGWGGISAGAGGSGGKQAGLYYFAKNDVINIAVGGAGTNAGIDQNAPGAGGNSSIGAGGAGGAGGRNTGQNAWNQGRPGAGGGGASGITKGAGETPSYLLVAGGGGGGGGYAYSNQSDITEVSDGKDGAEGTHISSLAGGIGTPGGDNSGNDAHSGGGGGGGGGGYYGGAGGSGGAAGNGTYRQPGFEGAGGSGGQNYMTGDVVGTEATPIPTNIQQLIPTNTRPNNRTDGYVVITYLGK